VQLAWTSKVQILHAAQKRLVMAGKRTAAGERCWMTALITRYSSQPLGIHWTQPESEGAALKARLGTSTPENTTAACRTWLQSGWFNEVNQAENVRLPAGGSAAALKTGPQHGRRDPQTTAASIISARESRLDD